MGTGSLWLCPVDGALSGLAAENQVTAVSGGAALHLMGSSVQAVGLVGCGPAVSVDSVHPFIAHLSVHMPDVEIRKGLIHSLSCSCCSTVLIRGGTVDI